MSLNWSLTLRILPSASVSKTGPCASNNSSHSILPIEHRWMKRSRSVSIDARRQFRGRTFSSKKASISPSPAGILRKVEMAISTIRPLVSEKPAMYMISVPLKSLKIGQASSTLGNQITSFSRNEKERPLPWPSLDLLGSDLTWSTEAHFCPWVCFSFEKSMSS